MRKHSLLSVFALLALGVCNGETFKTIGDLEDAIYQRQRYTLGCYKLLNASGPIGCSAPTDRPEEGVLMNVADAVFPLTDEWVLVVQMDEFEPLMKRLLTEVVSASHVKGVLLDPRGAVSSQSSAAPFPQSFAAPYDDKNYTWNPFGSTLWDKYFDFPVITLTDELAESAVTRAAYNLKVGFEGAQNWAVMKLTMRAYGNSDACLRQGTCSRIGSFSVWSALPYMAPFPLHKFPSPPAGSDKSHGDLPPASKPMPITLVIAQTDTGGFFHDNVQAAGSPTSGLVAMLTAMDLLKIGADPSAYTRRIIFLALAGEPWGYMGSRRLLWELDPKGAASWNVSSISTQGFDMELVDQVIELGMIGRAYEDVSNATTLYMHAQQPNTGFGDPGTLRTTIEDSAAMTAEYKLTILPASATNPGVPPSSLMSFLRYKPSIQGIVITEFDQEYKNPYYHSILDNGTYVQVEALVSTAILLARTLHTLASAGTPTAPLQVDKAAVRARAVDLGKCLMLDDPGLLCSLSYSMMKPSSTNKNAEGVKQSDLRHYTGILKRAATADPTSTNYKRDMQRFLFNFMANSTEVQRTDSPCDPLVTICPDGQVCYGWQYGTDPAKSRDSMGRCISSTTLFVQALSTRLLENDDGSLIVILDSDEFNAAYGWPVDPMWTESYWPTDSPEVRIYLLESYSTQVTILVIGILLTLLTGIIACGTRLAFDKHLKSQ